MATISVKHRGRRLGEILDSIDDRKLRRAISAKAAPKIQSEVKRQFVTQRDPYGKRWKPKKVRDGRPTLTGKTRNLRRNISKLVTTIGFRIDADTPYASFHQRGTKFLPIRMILPSPAKGLPPKWLKILSKISRAEIVKAIR